MNGKALLGLLLALAVMKPTVENLAIDDMIAHAAYAASLPPQPQH